MRIALLSTQWPGARMGGIGSYVRQCATALVSAEHEAHVFTFDLPADVKHFIPEGVTVHEIPDLATRVAQGVMPGALAAAISAGGEGVYRLALASLLCSRVLEVHRDSPFDIVEGPDVDALALPFLCGVAVNLPIVTHLHCCTAIAQQINGDSVSAHPTVTALEAAAIHLSDALCAPTQAVVELTRGIQPIDRNVRIIPHPFVCPDEPFAAPPINGPILFIGRIERLKGVEVLAEALNVFLARNPDARFVFVGPDTNTAAGRSMRQFVCETVQKELADRVSFTGELSPADVREQIRSAKFVVLPSLRENFSLACCETMAGGRTLVVSSDTGSVELIGSAGLIARRGCPNDLAQAMEHLHRDQKILNTLSRNAYDHARQAFEPKHISKLRTDFYAQIIAAFDIKERQRQMATLPSAITAAPLPALSSIKESLTSPTPSQSQSPGRRLLRIMSEIERHSGAPAQLLLYGAGKHTTRLLSERHLWESHGHSVIGIIDDHPRFAQSPEFLGLPVQSAKSALNSVTHGQSLAPIVLSTDTYEDQFWDQTAELRHFGVRVFRLYGSSEPAESADIVNVVTIGH